MAGKDREITLRFLAEPTDQNFGGKVHGGAVMKWIDLAAYACASGWSGKYCMTVYAGGIRFVRPILVGNVVEVMAQVIYTGTTSIHIGLKVHARDPKDNIRLLTTYCVVVMVAVDDEGKPTQVPEWIPETEEDKALQASAIRLMEMRNNIRGEMEEHILE